MKEGGTNHWSGASGANNSSGWTAFGGGYRTTSTAISFKDLGIWWLADSFSTPNAKRFYMIQNSANVGNDNELKYAGFSVRCIKD